MAPLNDPRLRSNRPIFGGGLAPSGADPPRPGGEGGPPDDGTRAFDAELDHADVQSRSTLTGLWIVVGVVVLIAIGYAIAATYLQPR